MSESRKDRGRELAEAANLVDIRSPADEFRALVEARMETLAKLGGAPARGRSSAARVELYREALEIGLAKIAASRPGEAPA